MHVHVLCTPCLCIGKQGVRSLGTQAIHTNNNVEFLGGLRKHDVGVDIVN